MLAAPVLLDGDRQIAAWVGHSKRFSAFKHIKHQAAADIGTPRLH
jgi:hypothetical protein